MEGLRLSNKDEVIPDILQRLSAGTKVVDFLFCSSVRVFLTFSGSPSVSAMEALLREYKEDDQAELMLRGQLWKLDLGGCPIGNSGARIVADFLKDDETVESVFLQACNIGPQGADAIAEALKRNKTVSYLDLFDNGILWDGGKSLCVSLGSNVSIKTLFVDYKDIASETAARIRYLTLTRNKVLIPAAARQTALCIIAARRTFADAGILSVFPKELVKMIAIEVWATRNDPMWIKAISTAEESARERQSVENWVGD